MSDFWDIHIFVHTIVPHLSTMHVMPRRENVEHGELDGIGLEPEHFFQEGLKEKESGETIHTRE